MPRFAPTYAPTPAPAPAACLDANRRRHRRRLVRRGECLSAPYHFALVLAPLTRSSLSVQVYFYRKLSDEEVPALAPVPPPAGREYI